MAADGMLRVVCCTHSPDLKLWGCLERALIAQTLPHQRWRLTVVDSGSPSPLDEGMLAGLRSAGVEANLVRVEEPGLLRARLRVIDEGCEPLLVFFDDDNEPAPDFLERVVEVFGEEPDLGCLSGACLKPEGVEVADWTAPFHDMVAWIDRGPKPLRARLATWGSFWVTGAGMSLRREVLQEAGARVRRQPRLRRLGRGSGRWPGMCEDDLMSRSADALGLCAGYEPSLMLIHHVTAQRFSMEYLTRLGIGLGLSQARLDLAWGVVPPRRRLRWLGRELGQWCRKESRQGWRMAWVRLCVRTAYAVEFLTPGAHSAAKRHE